MRDKWIKITTDKELGEFILFTYTIAISSVLCFLKAVDLYDTYLDNFIDAILFFTCIVFVIISIMNLVLALREKNLVSIISLVIYIQAYFCGLVLSGLFVSWAKLLMNK